MNNTQMACLQKLVNVLQECEGNGLTFSYASLMLNVEDDESQYLEYLSAQKLFELVDFIDGCGISKKKKEDLVTDTEYEIFCDAGGRVGDNSCTIEVKGGVITKWEVRMNIKEQWLEGFQELLWNYHTCDWDAGNKNPDYPYQLACAYFDWSDNGQPLYTIEEAFNRYSEEFK